MATKEQSESLRTREQKYKQRKYNDMYIEREVLFSDAFRKLTKTAMRVYLLFLNKRVMKPFVGKQKRSGKGKYYIENNGKIQFTYKEALENHGIIGESFRNAIDRLVEVGFIDITKSGSGLHKDVSLYALSDRWRVYGTDGFQEAKRPVRKQKYGFAKGNRLGEIRLQRKSQR